ncbi:MAG: SMC-Scp complex subunit ScpB [Pseudanabaena sp. ELA645]|jgi:segregation and condensation protein B
MTNDLPFEQSLTPPEVELTEADSKLEDAFEPDELVEPVESSEPLAFSMDLYTQPELPIANSLKQKVEAVLYLKGQPMHLAAIAAALGCELEDAEMGIIDLISEYAHRDSALEIVETDMGFSLRLRSEFEDMVNKLIPVDLGRGALRTLAAIALKKNILQSELIELRGAGAYQHVQELVEQGFIKKKRQADGGRSSVLQVTAKFHQYFEIDDLTKLI